MEILLLQYEDLEDLQKWGKTILTVISPEYVSIALNSLHAG